VIAIAGVAGLALLLRRAARLPVVPATQPAAFSRVPETFLERTINPQCIDHGGLSGVHALPFGLDAFAARMSLAQAAERSLDVQYYIWSDDRSGSMLVDALVAAAARGVRVRMLIDDFDSARIEPMLASLATLDNFEVRMFNPFVFRRMRWLNLLTDFARLNRRMHNKAFTADDHASVIGGRNIGDRYFDAARGRLFMDLDVLAIGPVVRQVSAAFEAYWTSASAYPAKVVLPSPVQELTNAPALGVKGVKADPVTRAYVKAVLSSTFIADLERGSLKFDWAEVTLISDDPAKALAKNVTLHFMNDDLMSLLGHPRTEIALVCGYFVPTPNSAAWLIQLAQKGVAVSIYTNAWDASDVRAVHSAYAKYRRQLLGGGVRLFEIRGGVAGSATHDRAEHAIGIGSSGGSVLHAKTFTVDRSRLFIGSFNLDPRSVRFNTEQGLVIESPTVAARMATALDTLGADLSYEVRLSSKGRLQWHAKLGKKLVYYDLEPGTTFSDRLVRNLMSHLPIDWIL
jgi:cardiolipin synthase C